MLHHFSVWSIVCEFVFAMYLFVILLRDIWVFKKINFLLCLVKTNEMCATSFP